MRIEMRTTVGRVALALVLASAPRLAHACPVCGLTGSNDNWGVYLAMTAVLSALPLAMIGGMVYFLHRRATREDSVANPASDLLEA